MHAVNVDPEDVFQALSDQTRIRIIRLLADSRSEACLCELSESLDEPEYKLSRHLKVLRQCGLLDAEKDGRWIYHKLNRSSSSFVSLFSFIQKLPDAGKRFASDLKRFESRKTQNQESRCRTEAKPIRSSLKKARS